MTEPVKFSLRNRWSGKVIFECELSPDVAAGDEPQKLRYAVQKGGESRADLRGADLHAADLSEADLRRVNLSGADLSGAELGGIRRSPDHKNGRRSSAPLLETAQECVDGFG